MATLHLSLQGKGGIGKSFIATLIAQYHLRNGLKPICFDTDPVNQTFAGYKALKVNVLRLGEKIDEINPRSFDYLIETILSAAKDDVFIIDNGSSTYLPLISYMVENRVIELFKEYAHDVIFHAILTGGQAYEDTHEGLEKLFKYFPQTQCVIWLNEYFGPVVKDDKGFEQTQLYMENEASIRSIITLPPVRKETFGADIEAMMKAHLTFGEAIENDAFSIMSRQRLKSVSKAIFETMEMAQL